MDEKLLIDTLLSNARPIGIALFFSCIIVLLLRTRVARRIKATIEDTVFSNWRLALLGTTGLVLSGAAGWRTWEGMYNFTGEPLLSGMVTFGIQGIMLIVAWLIGESFATGMNARTPKAQSTLVNPSSLPWVGGIAGLLLFVACFTLFLQWAGEGNIRNASAQDFSWTASGDKIVMFGAGLLMVALFTLYAASDLVRPYVQVFRIIVKNSMLWVMFFACMATSVFFSFDSFFTAIFPQSERVRAAELRAQNQVSGIITDIEQTIAGRLQSESDALFQTPQWADYEKQLNGITRIAAESKGAIERYVNSQIEERQRAIKEQQERMASAQAGQAGLAGRKTSITEEKATLAAQRPELAADYNSRKADYDAKLKEIDAKRVEALAEDKGVEGSGKAGRGPIYRERMQELSMLQAAANIAQERLKDSQKRLNTVEQRLAAIDAELATIDGDLAKYKGEAATAQQRIDLTTTDGGTAGDDPAVDPSRTLPAFDRAKSDFRAEPNMERLQSVQRMCGDIYGALSGTPETKEEIKGIDCDPKATADAAASLFALQAGTKLFNETCVGGDKLVANTSTDALFSFARRCLSDSALPSKDTEDLRAKINHIELSRDDKAHRFVVTLNAFQDGNRLAYLALAIAIGLDGLIFMSGLFGANAVRSPLSDIPTYRTRSASQLEATINAALGANPHQTAWITLASLKPITNEDGFSALADLSAMEKSQADRVRMVLTAGADIGAVETVSHNPERYRVRSELREYLSSVCDKQFKTDANAKDRAKLEELVAGALAPHLREHSDIVLNALEPIREAQGFTSQVNLSEQEDGGGKGKSKTLCEYDDRVVRRVLNAGATVKAVTPDTHMPDRYYVSPALYETLLTIRATSPESANYEWERRRFEGVQLQPPIEGGAMREDRPRLADRAAPALPIDLPAQKITPPEPLPLSENERAMLIDYFRRSMLASIDLRPENVDTRLNAESRSAMNAAWLALDTHAKKNVLLGHVLRRFQQQRDQRVAEAYSGLVSEIGGDDRKRSLLDAVDGRLRDDMGLYMLLPEMHLIDYLIEEIEAAAQDDDGLQPDEQGLKDQLKYVRQGLDNLNLMSATAWEEIRARLAAQRGRNLSNFLNRPLRRPEDYEDDADA